MHGYMTWLVYMERIVVPRRYWYTWNAWLVYTKRMVVYTNMLIYADFLMIVYFFIHTGKWS